MPEKRRGAQKGHNFSPGNLADISAKKSRSRAGLKRAVFTGSQSRRIKKGADCGRRGELGCSLERGTASDEPSQRKRPS